MRRPYFTHDTYHHIILRGSRGMNIFQDTSDWWHCLESLYFHNDQNRPEKWQKDLARNKSQRFERPNHWEDRDPLVSITAYCIHSNHLHIIVRQVQDDGISNFMRRLPKNLTHRYNNRYGGVGSIFQGPYQSRLIESEQDLRNVTLYVTAKNTMERYPEGGIDGAQKNMNTALKWASTDPFSSFPDYLQKRSSPILDQDAITTLYPSKELFQKDAYDYVLGYKYK